MCGILFYISKVSASQNKKKRIKYLEQALSYCKSRGPDSTCYLDDLLEKEHQVFMGFNRLAINGINPTSNQPIILSLPLDDAEPVTYTLICNGEIYNYKELQDMMGFQYRTMSDCESIIHIAHETYTRDGFGFDSVISRLDGVFAFVLLIENDRHNNNKPTIFVARDRFGVRPLYEYSDKRNTNHCYGVCSSLESATFIDTVNELSSHKELHISQFKPGHYKKIVIENDEKTNKVDYKQGDLQRYYSVESITSNSNLPMVSYWQLIHCTLMDAVEKRVNNTDRSIACLLSGGLDSSLITSLVTKIQREKFGADYKVETYSIGLEGSVDLKYARIVADFLNTNHTEIIVSEEEFIDAIPTVIQTIESYDTTTVRASVGNYLVSKYISEHSPNDAKVIFNGDGSDEITGGYMYFHKSTDDISFDIECKRLLKDIHYFDVLRSDRSISNCGLEARTPFLDHTFVQTYLSIPSVFRAPGMIRGKCEKYLLRQSFDNGQFLPKEVLWRSKEAFSDGVSSHSRSWYQIIQEKLPESSYYKAHKKEIESMTFEPGEPNIPTTMEQRFYRYVFRRKFYKSNEHVIPYFWMPRFVNATDSSARTLDFYDHAKYMYELNKRLENNKRTSHKPLPDDVNKLLKNTDIDDSIAGVLETVAKNHRNDMNVSKEILEPENYYNMEKTSNNKNIVMNIDDNGNQVINIPFAIGINGQIANIFDNDEDMTTTLNTVSTSNQTNTTTHNSMDIMDMDDV